MPYQKREKQIPAPKKELSIKHGSTGIPELYCNHTKNEKHRRMRWSVKGANNLAKVLCRKRKQRIMQYNRTFFQDIYRRKPEAVGFSCYLWNIEYVMGLAGDLKKCCQICFYSFWRTGSKLSSGGSALQNTNTQTLLWLARASGPFRNLWHTLWMVTEKFHP